MGDVPARSSAAKDANPLTMRALCFLAVLALAGTALADHYAAPPHYWIQPHKNLSGVSCCGKNDVAEIPQWEAAQAVVGSEITATFPAQGQQTVTVQKIFPSEDGKAYVTFYGCLFKHFGI